MSARAPRLPWAEIAIEAAALGTFMVSACVFTALLEHPASPVRHALPSALSRRALMGAFMGLTAVLLIYSPWGRRSGAHMNPAVTLSFLALGRIPHRIAAAYVAAQFVGGALGVGLSSLALGALIADPAVRWAVTVPGPAGNAAAFGAEFAISFGLMSAVLLTSRSPSFERFTGLVAGILVGLWILIEAPLSGMSMNPARTFGSAMFAMDWTAFWIYAVAPVAAMLGAAGAFGRPPRSAVPAAACAKLRHADGEPCIFCAARELPDVLRH